jgi:hypothetical protein
MTQRLLKAQRALREKPKNPVQNRHVGHPAQWKSEEKRARPPEGGRYVGELVRRWQSWSAHQVDEHFIEFFGVQVHEDFDSLELALGLVSFEPR